ncbi:hypothetical protein ACS0TY_024784 [Phlomoides rotata]
MAFNEPLFRFGRRHSRYLRVWFSMGIGFSLAAVFVTMLILYQNWQKHILYIPEECTVWYLLVWPSLFDYWNEHLTFQFGILVHIICHMRNCA